MSFVWTGGDIGTVSPTVSPLRGQKEERGAQSFAADAAHIFVFFVSPFIIGTGPFGWKAVFIFHGGLGLLWAVFWGLYINR